MKTKCQACGSENIIMIEYFKPETPGEAIYDGVSEIRCNDCNARFGRWSLKRLKDDELERRYGGMPVSI